MLQNPEMKKKQKNQAMHSPFGGEFEIGLENRHRLPTADSLTPQGEIGY
jgi:hypothetical protein